MPKTKLYVGYDLENRRFRDEQDETIPEQNVRELWENCQLDCTQMVFRLITQHDWDGDSLAKFYAEHE